MLAGPIERQTKGRKTGSSVLVHRRRKGRDRGRALGDQRVRGKRAHAQPEPRPTRDAHDTSLHGRLLGLGSQRPKFTFGACLASAGTSQYGYSLNLNIFAVRLDGKRARCAL